MMRRALPTVLIALSLSPLALATEKTVCAAPPATVALVQAEQALHAALLLVQQKAFDQAGPALDSVISASSFNELIPIEQHKALSAAAFVAVQIHNMEKADNLLTRATAMNEATEFDWKLRLITSQSRGDVAGSIKALTQLAQFWPDSLHEVPDQDIFRLIRLARQNPADDAELKLLDALAAAKWTLKDGTQPNSTWKELTLLRAAQGDMPHAAAAAALITSPGVLVSLKADQRFADAVAADPQHYDVEKAAAEEIEHLRSTSQARPRSLEAVERLGIALIQSGHYEDALDLTDRTIASIGAAPQDGPAFDDMDTKLIWIYDTRARALEGLGRWTEATEQEQQASLLPEHGHANISQALNLAGIYSDLNKPKEALEVVSAVADSSPFIRMQKQAVRHAAALELGDSKAAADALAYMREHRNDAIHTYLEELVRADQLDEAAAVLASRLSDPKQRNDALAELQDYLPPPTTPQTQALEARWTELKARADVQASVAKVGKIGKYSIAEGAE